MDFKIEMTSNVLFNQFTWGLPSILFYNINILSDIIGHGNTVTNNKNVFSLLGLYSPMINQEKSMKEHPKGNLQDVYRHVRTHSEPLIPGFLKLIMGFACSFLYLIINFLSTNIGHQNAFSFC